MRSALERLRVDGASVDALAAAFGFTLPASVETTYPVLRPILPPEEKEAFVRYLLRMGYQSTLVDITPSTDGLNHFNIYSQGRTEIGRMASNFTLALVSILLPPRPFPDARRLLSLPAYSGLLNA